MKSTIVGAVLVFIPTAANIALDAIAGAAYKIFKKVFSIVCVMVAIAKLIF